MTAHTCKFFGCRALLAITVAVAATSASAQAWSGAGPDSNWSTGANWVGGVAPASGPTTQVSFATGPNRSPVVDAPWTVNRITFLAQYTLSGQAITLAGANPVIQGSADPTISNPIILTGPTSIASIASLNLTGGISGTGPVVFGGVAGITLSGTNTYSGGTTMNFGTLSLRGSMLGPVTVAGTAGGLAGVNGTINGPVVVEAGGSISGTSLVSTLATGSLTVAGTMFVQFNGTAPGQYATISVTGPVVLNNATLALIATTYVPAEGDVFTLIDNDGADPVVGTFAGLPEGSIVLVNGVPRRVSYVGGSGNDVTLGPTALGGVREAPTLSEWALVVLALMMLAAGLRGARRSP